MANISNLIQTKEAARPQGSVYNVGQYLPLDQIRTDGGTQARDGLNADTVAEYAESWLQLSHRQNGFLEMPLIIVYHDGKDYWLADGFHRVAAYAHFVNGPSASASPRAIRAEVRQGTRRDAVLYACGANATHGLRRTQADKRRAIETLLRDDEWRQWSDSEIARRVVVDHKTVASVRADLYPGNSQDSRTVTRGGTTYQMTPAASKPQPIISEVAPTPDLADMLKRLDAHGYAKSGQRTKGMTTFYSFRDYRNELEDGNAGEIELAEGELPLWLQDLDSKASYAQAKQERYLAVKARAEALGYSLKREGLYFALYRAGMFLTQATLDQMEKTIAGHERDAARKRVAAAPADVSDDSVTIAAIRRQAEELGMQVAWEDDQVILYWQVDDIDGLAPMSYAAALDWLKAAWMEREKSGASDSAAHRAKEIRDAGRIERARSLIGNGEYDAARVVLDQVEVSTWDRDKLLATIPIEHPARAQAEAFLRDQRDRLTRFSKDAMISQTTYLQALAHIEALLEMEVTD